MRFLIYDRETQQKLRNSKDKVRSQPKTPTIYSLLEPTPAAIQAEKGQTTQRQNTSQ